MRSEIIVALWVALSAGAADAAQTIVLKGDLQATADQLTASFRSDSLELQGNVHFVQGPNSITANRASANDSGSDKSTWTFDGDVHIQTAEADLLSNIARATFNDGTIETAKIEGSPARFEQRGVMPDQQVRGRAGVIEYDFKAGLVTLTNDVWFTHGHDQEFSGGTVVYNVRDESVRVNPNGKSSGRVRGIIRPRPKSGGATTGAAVPGPAPVAQVATESGS
jgi:lipopolysaccharide transport protein LptA